MNRKVFLLSVFLFINYIGAISQNKIISEDVLALNKIETPSFTIDFEYNQYGHVISETKVVFGIDYLSYKFEYGYDASGNITLLKKYDKNFEVWNFTYYEENEYNDDNQVTTKKIYQDYGAGFKFVKQLFYTYQDTFLETVLEQLISSGGQEFNNIKQDFFYNKKYQLFQIKKNDWIGNSWWLHTETFDFEYDDSGNLLTYSSEVLIGEDFMKNWRYIFIYNDNQELIERAYYQGFYDFGSIPTEKYLYHFEAIKENEAILFPNAYQFDFLDFNWFQSGKKLLQDDYWVSDCGGNIRFVESADYSYMPFTLEVGVKNYDRDDISIYPNPVTEELRITSYELRVEGIEIFDVFGKKQKAESERQNGENGLAINISHFPTGIYFVRIQTGKEMVIKKIIKQ